MSEPRGQASVGTARCTGAPDCPASDHVLGCYAGPGWGAGEPITLALTMEQAFTVRSAMYDYRAETRRYLSSPPRDTSVDGCECANCTSDRARAAAGEELRLDLEQRLAHVFTVLALLPRFPKEIEDAASVEC